MEHHRTCSLLVSGYIRENEQLIRQGRPIPAGIVILCLGFYEILDIAFYLAPRGLFIANFDHNHSKYTNWKCKVIDLNYTKSTMYTETANNKRSDVLQRPDYWFIRSCGLNYAKDIKLPTQILQKVNESYNCHPITHKHKLYNILFKCGGKYSYPASAPTQCGAIILDKNQINTKPNASNPKQNIVTTYFWNLPNLSYQLYGNYVLYSSKFGLLSIAGDSSLSPDFAHCYRLSFDFNANMDLKQWKWETLGNPYDIGQRTHPSACLISDIDKEMAVVCGGYHGGKFVGEIQSYDLYENKWNKLSDLNIGRCESGIYYDTFKNDVIYIAGGDSKIGALHDVEYLDLHKNKCYMIQPTRMQHENYPLLWRQDQLLCIASISAKSNGFEWIDLRQGKRWRVMYFPGSNKSLSSLFGHNVPSDKLIVTSYRLVR